VQPDGALSLLTPGGKTATTAGGVTDLATSRNSRFLYSRLGNGTVGAFEIDSDGGLSPLPVGTGLPVGAAGIAAR
jgi:6-phosphogluconolactonase (cycloisomerase 2 family)